MVTSHLEHIFGLINIDHKNSYLYLFRGKYSRHDIELLSYDNDVAGFILVYHVNSWRVRTSHDDQEEVEKAVW